jgi:hypothetical protein
MDVRTKMLALLLPALMDELALIWWHAWLLRIPHQEIQKICGFVKRSTPKIHANKKPSNFCPICPYSGWCFQTFVIFHFIYGLSSFPWTFIFFKGLETTNQYPLVI